MGNDDKHKVVCFGEVLWDILPTGAEPGGAPMNVAYHLYKQGINPALITKIGIDEKGKELLDVFSSKGVCTDFFQVDDDFETGKVYATPNEQNEVVYDIVKPSAWDFIVWENSMEALVKNAEYFVYGSLASRNSVSQKTLFQLLEIANKKVLDINLRAPHYNKTLVVDLIQKADFLKLNLEELELITSWFFNYTSTEDRMKSISDKFKISNMVVTMGGGGAILFMDGNVSKHAGFKVDVMDTVGSGDAFLAGLFSKFIEQGTNDEALAFASGLGAFIATQRGPCPDYELQDVYTLINNMKTKSKIFN